MELGPLHAVASRTMHLDWASFVENSPFATFLIDGATGRRGDILGANAAARSRFAPTARALFDLVASEHNAELASVLTGDVEPIPPLAVMALAGHRSGDSPASPQAMALHLHRDPSGHFVAQMVPSDGWHAVESVLEEQHRFRAALMELSELAHTTQDDDDFYQRLIERAVEVVPGAQGGSVQLHIPETTGFRFVAALGYDLAGLQRHVLDRVHWYRDAHDPVAKIVHNLRNDVRSPEIRRWLETVGRLNEIKVNVSAPVIVDGSLVAFLALDNFEDPAAMSETSVEMTTVLGRLIGELWSRRELEATVRREREAFRHQSLHDPLTALPNRRNLERTLTDILATNRRRERPTAVLFADIDDFKGANDRLGHQVGDLLLISVANALSETVRAGDLVGRWGGDEFLVLASRLEDTTEATSLAQRVLEHFNSELWLGNGSRYRARLSIGVGWTPASQLDGDTLVKAADEALYEAKSAGKGVVRTRVTSC